MNDDVTPGSTSITEQSRAVVRGFFEGFARGDMAAVFAALAPDIEYTVNTRDTVTCEAIPWSTTHRGIDAVQAFFGRLMQNFEVLGFDLWDLVADGAAVAAFGHFKYRVRSTGLDCETDWCARFALEGGRVVRYQFFEDSYAIARAFRVAGHWELAVDGARQRVPASA